jgi:hypothetical protein
VSPRGAAPDVLDDLAYGAFWSPDLELVSLSLDGPERLRGQIIGGQRSSPSRSHGIARFASSATRSWQMWPMKGT